MFAFYLSIFIHLSVCVSGVLSFYFCFDVSITFLLSSSILAVCIPLPLKAIWIRSAFLHLFLVPRNIRYQHLFLVVAAAAAFFLLRCRSLTHHGHVPFMHLLLYLEFGALHSSMPLWNIHSVSQCLFSTIFFFYIHLRFLSFYRRCVCASEFVVVWEMGNFSWKAITKTRYERRFMEKNVEKK